MLLLLVFSLCCAGFFIFNRPVQSTYQESIDEGERYLYDLDFSKAEEFYLQARKIEPKNPEPYKKLYEIYMYEDDSDKAENIKNEAKDNLESDDYIDFEEITDEIQNDYKGENLKFEVIADLGELDRAPINIGDLGWIIQKDGLFGMIDSEGTLIAKPENKQFKNLSLGQDGSQSVACLYPTAESEPSLSLSDHPEGAQWHCPRKEENIIPGMFALDDNNQLNFVSIDPDMIAPSFMGDYPIITAKNPVFDANDPRVEFAQAVEGKEFYFYHVIKQRVFGPYDADEVPAYSKLELNSEDFNNLT